MGILEEIRDQNAKILALLEGGATASTKPAAAADAPKAETAAQKKAREKAEAEAKKPSFTAEELRDKFLEVMSKHGEPKAKELIAELGYDKLAKLIADAGNWQKSWEAAEAQLALEPEAEGEEDNGGL